MHPNVVGVVGRNGSGKDEIVDYLRDRCGVVKLSAGDMVRQRAERRGLAPTRENLHAVSIETMQREGDDVFALELIDKIVANDWTAVGVTGLRSPADVKAFRSRFKDRFRLAAVIVGDQRLRFERLRRRDEPRDPQTWDDFRKQERKEEKRFSIGRSIREADIVIANHGSLDRLHRNIEKSPIWQWLCRQTGSGRRLQQHNLDTGNSTKEVIE